MSEKELWSNVAKKIIKAGFFNNPLSDTITEIVKTLLSEEQAEFLDSIFNKPTLNIEQIKEKTNLDDDTLEKMLKSLIDSRVIMATPSRHTDIMVYRLLPLFPGIFEQVMMKGETSEKEKKLSILFNKVYDEMIPVTQNKYDKTIKYYKKFPAIDRIIPVEEEINVSVEKILPFEEVKRMIDKHDVIGLGFCYCRHGKDLIGDPCKLNASRENCMYLGKIGKFLIQHNFAKQITKEEARKILKESEKSGLVHKTFHDRLNPELDEIIICSCCKCCCGIFGLYYRGVVPLHSLTSYQSKVNKDECVGCGTCIEKCPTEAIGLIDAIAVVNKDKCIGCGLCAFNCPEKAMSLERIGPRNVFIRSNLRL